jgi:Holliday junction resolvase YEN1
LTTISLRPSIEACEEIVPIAQLAEEHYVKHGRPLKIAVDEADWRFHSVTPAQIAAMRKGQPSHPEIVLTVVNQ